MTPELREMIDAGPAWTRPGMRLLLALGSRPRGLKLLERLAPADQAAAGLLAMARYDDPELARSLGFDADAIVSRGRELRQKEGRP